MTTYGDDEALQRAHEHARRWLDGAAQRPVAARSTVEEQLAAVGGPLPAEGLDPAAVVDLLATSADPGLMAIRSGRFFGWVMGGTLPAALAADWLVSAWDQNAGMRHATPAVAALEEVAGAWLLDVLGLPSAADVGFVTGATMANFSCLAAAREQVLADAGWDVNERGLNGAPPITVDCAEATTATTTSVMPRAISSVNTCCAGSSTDAMVPAPAMRVISLERRQITFTPSSRYNAPATTAAADSPREWPMTAPGLAP